MNRCANANEQKVGAHGRRFRICRAKIDNRTRIERQAEKQAVAGAEVAEIKKSVRRHLKQQLFGELEEGEHRHRQDSLD